MTDPHLVVAGLVTGYGPLPVVHDVDLTLEQGSVTALLGANGAGKTALVHAIAGLQRPLAGRIMLWGEDVTQWSATRIARRSIRLVPADRHLFGDMHVHDHLRLAAEKARGDHRTLTCTPVATAATARDTARDTARGTSRGATRADMRGAIERVLAVFPRLAERRRQAASTMSGGEQQMLALARALVAEPNLLILDEPSTGLAPTVIADLYQAIEAWCREHGTTVLVVEQQPHPVLALADRALVMSAGRIVADGDPHAVADDQRLWQIYAGVSGQRNEKSDEHTGAQS
ncbi:MAG: ABC transporter ATP-binding protein [Nitriliruptoraceae bacterium]